MKGDRVILLCDRVCLSCYVFNEREEGFYIIRSVRAARLNGLDKSDRIVL